MRALVGHSLERELEQGVALPYLLENLKKRPISSIAKMKPKRNRPSSESGRPEKVQMNAKSKKWTHAADRNV